MNIIDILDQILEIKNLGILGGELQTEPLNERAVVRSSPRLRLEKRSGYKKKLRVLDGTGQKLANTSSCIGGKHDDIFTGKKKNKKLSKKSLKKSLKKGKKGKGGKSARKLNKRVKFLETTSPETRNTRSNIKLEMERKAIANTEVNKGKKEYNDVPM